MSAQLRAGERSAGDWAAAGALCPVAWNWFVWVRAPAGVWTGDPAGRPGFKELCDRIMRLRGPYRERELELNVVSCQA